MAEGPAPELGKIADLAAAHALSVMGGVHANEARSLPGGAKTVILLGPSEPGFWAHFTAQPEYHDGVSDPMDRWSMRAIAAIATKLGAQTVFPFGDKPYHPFQAWAVAAGRAWVSPVGFLVHDTAGLMISFRGALAFDVTIDLTASEHQSPCASCVDQPCTRACPVGALGPETYNLSACHGFLDTSAGQDCMTKGCAARNVCPISETYGRLYEHSAYHMRQFHR